MLRTTNVGFLDLPLEIRQQIYRECLPRTYGGDCLAQLPYRGDDRLLQIREAVPHLNSEIWDEWRMDCETMHFRVAATKWDPPPLTRLPVLRTLVVEYEQPPNKLDICCPRSDCDCSKNQDQRARGERTLATMYFNLVRFLTWLPQSGNAQHMQYLDVNFLGCDTGCPSWYREVYECGYDDDTFEYTEELLGFRFTSRTAANGREVTVIESLLVPFQKFPVVPKVKICTFGPPSEKEIWEEDPVELAKFRKLGTQFDGHYVATLMTCWQLWKEGMRYPHWRRLVYLSQWSRDQLLHEEDIDADDSDGDDTDGYVPNRDSFIDGHNPGGDGSTLGRRSGWR